MRLCVFCVDLVQDPEGLCYTCSDFVYGGQVCVRCISIIQNHGYWLVEFCGEGCKKAARYIQNFVVISDRGVTLTPYRGPENLDLLALMEALYGNRLP